MSVFLVAFVLLLSGCGSTIAQVTRTANALAVTGDQINQVLGDEYEHAQNTCIEEAATADAARDCAKAVRERHEAAWSAYRAFRKAWLALSATIQSAETIGKEPDVTELLRLSAKLGAAFEDLRRAIQDLGLIVGGGDG